MPGIAGLISVHLPEERRRGIVGKMTRSLLHEPFYVSGECSWPELGVCAGWVAFDESFAANQPFSNEQKGVTLLFSGECFSEPQLQNELKQRGHDIGPNPGDWLVHLYEEEDAGLFESLNGLFSGLLLDKRQGRAFLFNDRYAFERIYFAETEEALYFASEAKAILRVLPESRVFSIEGLSQFGPACHQHSGIETGRERNTDAGTRCEVARNNSLEGVLELDGKFLSRERCMRLQGRG